MRLVVLLLLFFVGACSKMEADDSLTEFAQCESWTFEDYDYGDGVDRKSQLWSCVDTDGEDCQLIYSVEDPDEYAATSCEAMPKTGVSFLPFRYH
jgi:hypothetical protein